MILDLVFCRLQGTFRRVQASTPGYRGSRRPDGFGACSARPGPPIGEALQAAA
jgi:hypothetical protein